MKRLKIISVLIIFLFLLTGCVGKEPNEIAYIVALGIDSGENGKYKITIQYANPSEISGGDEGGDVEESGVESLVLEASDIYAALGIADQLESKTFSLSHTKLIIVSRETSENGIRDMAEMFIRNEELRPDVYLAVAENGAEEYLQNVNPATEVNPAKYYSMIFDKNKFVGLPEGILKNFFISADTGNYDLLLPIAHTSKEETVGSAVFKDGKMVGEIGAFETEIYKLLDRDRAFGYLTLQNDTTLKNPVTIKTVQKKPPKYDIDIDNKTIDVKLKLEGDIYAVSPDYRIEADLDTFEKNCEEYVSGECEKLMRGLLTDMKSDIFRLTERSKAKFLTNEDYDYYKNHVDYSDFEIKVETDFDIRRTGLIVKEV